MLFPLQPVSKAKIDVRFLDPHYPRTLGLHTGLDINGVGGGDTDLGMPFVSIYEGEVVYSTDSAPSGAWGGLIVVWHPGLNVWTRYAHHKRGTCKVKVGDLVKEGQELAGIGKGRNNIFMAHLHFDVIYKKPSQWTDWPGLNRERLLSTYMDPILLFKKWNVKLPPGW